MTSSDNNSGNTSCRIGLMSRIDFPSDGFRKAALEKAKEIFAREDVHFVDLAGGLVSARYVKEKSIKLKKRVAALKKQIKLLEGKPARSRGKKAEKPEKSDEAKRNAGLIKELEAQVERFQSYLDELSPEKMAEQLAKLMPVFTNAKGEPVKTYIFPSPAYDGDIGETVAQLLAEARDDIRVYQAGGDRQPIKQAGKILEVLVPEKSVWMRGDYFSTPVERILKDKRRQSSREMPDLQVIGCFGSTITKPQGELPRPYVTVPVLHRLSEVRVNENQIGVRVITVFRDRTNPVTKNFSLKDHIGVERSYITLPKNLTPKQQKLLELLKANGRLSTGVLADMANMNREAVEKELKPLVGRDGRRPKNWPGLRYDAKSKRWDFDGYWVRENLLYPPIADGKSVDSVLAFGCLHAGSIYADYKNFLEMMPRAILERDANVLIGAGDLAEGFKYRDEIYGAMNVTDQERLAGEILAKVIIEVFRARFKKAVDQLPSGGVNADQLMRICEQSLLTLVVIPGNHDLWSLRDGHTPLVVMKNTIVGRVCEAVSGLLNSKGYCVPCLMALVCNKIVEPGNGVFTLPSGLKVSVMHPWMGRAKTTSLRPQEMLEKAADCQLVVGANFHVGEHLEMWDSELGQRVCLQLGTIKRQSGFENNKLKTVDYGFGYVRLESDNGRIVKTEATFYSSPPGKDAELDPGKVFKDLLVHLGLKS